MGRSDDKATELKLCPEGKDFYAGLKQVVMIKDGTAAIKRSSAPSKG